MYPVNVSHLVTFASDAMSMSTWKGASPRKNFKSLYLDCGHLKRATMVLSSIRGPVATQWVHSEWHPAGNTAQIGNNWLVRKCHRNLNFDWNIGQKSLWTTRWRWHDRIPARISLNLITILLDELRLNSSFLVHISVACVCPLASSFHCPSVVSAGQALFQYNTYLQFTRLLSVPGTHCRSLWLMHADYEELETNDYGVYLVFSNNSTLPSTNNRDFLDTPMHLDTIKGQIHG